MRRNHSGKSICRDCGEPHKTLFIEWSRVAAPRCSKCGGLLDKVFVNRAPHQQAGYKDKSDDTNIVISELINDINATNKTQ